MSRWRGAAAPSAASVRSDVLLLLGTAAAIAVLSWGALALQPSGYATALWWPAAGAAVAAVVAARPGLRPWVVLLVAVVSALGNVAGGRPLAVSALFGLSNAAEAALAGWWIAGRQAHPAALSTASDLGRLVVGALLGSLAIAAGASATVVALADGPLWPTFPRLVASHASAIIVLVPLVLAQRSPRTEARPPEVALQAAVSVLSVVAVFGPEAWLPIAFLVMVPLVWGAVRLPLRPFTLEVVAVLVLALLLSRTGGGPFHDAGARSGAEPLAALLTQLWVVCTFLIALSLAIAVTQRRALLAQVTDSERLLRAGFNDSLLGTLIVRPGGDAVTIVEANEVATELLGLSGPAAARGQDWLTCIDAPPDSTRAALQAVQRDEVPAWRAELPMRHREGEPARWAEVAATAMSATGLVVLHLVEVTSRRLAEAQVERMTLYDPLTGLPNRVLLADRVQRTLAASGRSGTTVAVMVFDLDDFKQVNDTLGHAAGDQVLVEVANRLRGALRSSDTVGRIGGDEFVMAASFPDPGRIDEAVARVVSALAPPLVVEAGTFTVTVSVGVAVGGPGSTAEQLLRDADTAMHVSKGGGRARLTRFEDAHRANALRDARIAADFEGAVEGGELRLHVQPIVALDGGRVVAAEALVRWQHPVQGLLLPGDWLDVASRGPTGRRLEQWVLGEAGRILADWTRRWGAGAPQLHVNASTGLLSGGGLAGIVAEAMAAAGAPADGLVLELTESDLEIATGSLTRELELLRRRGTRVAVDDFGTGYSSFARLADLPIDVLKIDRSFVARMTDEDRSRAIVSALVGLSSALGLRLVAEGVETREQAAALRSLGCPFAQGFLWSRAVPVAEFPAPGEPLQEVGLGVSRAAP